MRGTDCPLLAVGAALAREQLWLRRAGELPLLRAVRMHPCRQPCVLEMDIDHIADQHAVRLDGALVPERGVLLCPAAFGVRPVIPLEVRRGGAGMCVVLSCRDEQMEVGLMAVPSSVVGSWKA